MHPCWTLTCQAKIDPESVALFYCVAVRLFNRFLEQYVEPEDRRDTSAQRIGDRQLALRS